MTIITTTYHNTISDQLFKIFQRRGTPNAETWPAVMRLPHYNTEFPQWREHPVTDFVPLELLGGIAGVYNDIRSQWGTEGFSTEMQAGTDEYIQGSSSGGGPAHTYNGLNGTNFGSAWGIAFTDINTLNGVLKFGQELTL